MTDAAHLTQLRAHIATLDDMQRRRAKALFSRGMSDDELCRRYTADPQFAALTAAKLALQEQADEMAEQQAALAAVQANVAARNAQADTGFRDFLMRGAA